MGVVGTALTSSQAAAPTTPQQLITGKAFYGITGGAVANLPAGELEVVPEVDGDTPLNLREFHDREAGRYIIAHNFFALVALALVLALDGIVAESIVNVGSAFVAFCLGTAAYFARGRPQLVITVMLAILATMFMIANINILAGGPGR